MTDRCPTCGQPIQCIILEPEELLRALTNERDVYKSISGTWRLTATPNLRVAPEAVYELVKWGKIVRKYSDCDDCYCVGRTIDVSATVARRKREGKNAPLVYVVP